MRKSAGIARAPAAKDERGSRFVLIQLLLLAALTVATFWPVLRNAFINLDDPVYVTHNESVSHGLTWAGVRWAFTTGQAANWHPLTWLSHMADVSVFGLNPRGHHASSVALHVVNTLLVFLAFRSLSGDRWRSAWVAALFAVHPAHVESVAWVAERKDLLCTAFGLAAIWAYGRWVREGGVGRYAAVLLLFAAGLMSKPMLVSLPLVLLLLDVWPLSRREPLKTLVLEKAPLFLMAAASSLVTILVQRAGGAVGSLEKFSLLARVGNALVATVRYLGMFFWPANLAVFYPHPGISLPAWKVLGSALLLLAISFGALAARRTAPFLFVGWFWFVITLVPVIGLVQVGLQAMADRYTYLPFIGLFVAVAWGVLWGLERWRTRRLVLLAAAAATVLALALAAAAQVRYWRTSEILFLHALETTRHNDFVENNLGDYYNDMGRPSEALPHLLEAMRIRPTSGVLDNVGRSLFLLGRLDEAAERFSEALRLRPADEIALNNLARARFLQGEIPESVRLYEAAVALAPGWAEVRWRLAVALLLEGQPAAALVHLHRAVALAPQEAEPRRLLEGALALERNDRDGSSMPMRQFLAGAHQDAAVALGSRGKRAAAAVHLRQALELFPAFGQAHNEMGSLLAQDGRLDEAAAEFREAVRLEPGLALAHNNLGYMLFLKGQRQAAIEQYREALRLEPGLAMAQKNLELALHGQTTHRSR